MVLLRHYHFFGGYFDFAQQDQTWSLLFQSFDVLAVPFTNDCIHISIAEPMTLIDDCRLFFDASG
jgi:hypothetical protein